MFVSRSDQDSRKKTVEEIKRRAHSGGEWPQVNGRKLCSQQDRNVKNPSIYLKLIRPGRLQWQRNEINGQSWKAVVIAERPVVTVQESWSFPGSAGWSTHVTTIFPKSVIVAHARSAELSQACVLTQREKPDQSVQGSFTFNICTGFISLNYVLFFLLYRSWFFPRERAPTDPA